MIKVILIILMIKILIIPVLKNYKHDQQGGDKKYQ